MKKIILLFIFIYCANTYCQTPAITINLSSSPSADTSSWGTGSNIFNIIVAGPNMGMLIESTVLVTIKSNGSIRCGGNSPSSAQPSNIINAAPKSWIGSAAAGLLGEDCILVPGAYELCVHFYGFRGAAEQNVLLEKCVPFIIQGKNEEVCSPPININPVHDKVFAEQDLLALLTFNWSPIISTNHGLVTYRLLVWEVEEGQTNALAIYNNQPIIEEDIKGQPRYITRPGVIEKRNAKYVWRVIALDAEGKPICEKAQSEPTNFSVEIQEKKTEINTPCGNGDFESSILDPTEWSAGYTNISGNNSTFSPSFNNIMQPANGNPIDDPLNTGCGNQANENHHVIVSVGFDSYIQTLSKVPPSTIPNKYAVRLGNDCPGCGTERIQKKFVVTAGNTDYKFMYALVFQAPHTLVDNPSLWVRVYDASGTPITGIVYLNPLSTTPLDRAVSDLTNPYWKTYNGILYRDWACARIDLSKLVGQTITVEILTNDCAQCGHWGYGYFDNFCIGCDNNPPTSNDCCMEIINPTGNTVNVTPLNIMTIAQDFNITPLNIKRVTAEIISVQEDPITLACMKCINNEDWVYEFISHNTASWNSGVALNASPVNSDGYYPASLVEWNCNQQGNLKLNFKIALAGKEIGCTRKGKIGIRYSFTDIDCITCEKIIFYNYTSN